MKKKVVSKNFLILLTIPVICTYESKIFTTTDDVLSDEFEEEYKKEVDALQKLFADCVSKIKVEKGEPIRSNLNIILILLPIPSKKELVKLLHQKTWRQQHA